MEIKRLAKFYAQDRPPRKRLRTLLEFLRNPTSSSADAGNIAVAVQSLLTGASKDTPASAADNLSAVTEFWADAANANMVFSVLTDCVTELETHYAPHENAFRKVRKKPLEAEDWNDIFESLEMLIRNNTMLIHEGWNNNGFTILFAKLLKRDNHALIKKYAFRCLALYTDATRNLQQLASMSSTSGASTFSSSATVRGGSVILKVEDLDIDEDDHTRGTAILNNPSSSKRKTMHLELLRESIDFSPYGGGNIILPDKFINEGVHVEGWMRPMPTQAEEPVDMLKYLMDLSLERQDPRVTNNPKINHKARGERFVFWAELIMRFYMPILYPKICIKVKLKEEGDTIGFFHHCPGSFQRVVARWIYKFRSREECMELLWSRRDLSEVIMETIRQRFAYRDSELVLDAIKFYSGICNGAQYIPDGMKSQMNETSRAMISHVSQLFHPSVQLEDSKILLHCIELLELVSQRKLDDYTSTYLRKFVVSTIDNCTMLREPNNVAVLSAMISVVLHVWMHAAIISKATGSQVWIELTIAIRRWLVNPNDAKIVGAELINCWKRELRFTSCLLMYVIDGGQSTMKITSDGAILVPVNGPPSVGNNGGKDVKGLSSKQSYLQSAANFLQNSVTDVEEATLLQDRVLHLIPPPTVSVLPPYLHFSLFEGLLRLVELWINSAICSQRNSPTDLHHISPSTIIALFGEWFLPACELESPDYQNSRCLAVMILCKLCSVRCLNKPTRNHLTILARILFKGITSPSGMVVSTVLQHSSAIFTYNLEGMNALVPAFLYAVDQIIIHNIWGRAEKAKVKSSDWNKELNAALDVVFSILALPKRFPNQNFVSWQRKIQRAWISEDLSPVHDIIQEIPESQDDFHVILGRILVRIADLPFTDVSNIKQRALWGLYCLVVANLKVDVGVHCVDHIHLAEWIVYLIDACQAVDFSISMTALSILQDMSDFHEEINSFEPVLVARIVMTLAVFAQQQVEEASIEVQSAMESMGTMDGGKSSSLTGGEKLSGSAARISGGNSGNKVGSDNKLSRLENNESNDPFSKLKSKLKPGQNVVPTPSPLIPPTNSPAQPPPPTKEHEIPALRLIVQKTSAIFECLRFWVIHRPEVLQDNDVKKLLFSAIEAALVGTLPDGGWQKEVERARTLERRMSMPLLFLGLQMRASLDSGISQSWLKCFEETAVAAEGLLMHLLHHINGFPSPAGVDQMISNCSELNETEGSGIDDDRSPKASDAATLSFILMDSIVVSVVGSLDSPCARLIVRDMTGLFTWEITPAVSRVASARRNSEYNSSKVPDVADSALLKNTTASDIFSLHHPDGAVQVEFKSMLENRQTKNGICMTCGGERSQQKSSDPAVGSDSKLILVQVPWEKEKKMLSNNICPIRSNYLFHEDANGSSGQANSSASEGSQKDGQKKKGAEVKSTESEKMPATGNKDERQERLERVAKAHEERNNIGAQQQQQPKPAKQCDCRPSVVDPNRTMTSVCGLFDMDENEPNVGALDAERCMLDLVLDSIPMVFRDCGGDTTDKTLLGGRYSMMRYNMMDLDEETNPLVKDSSDISGFSFLQRLIHDEECYAQLKAFLSKNDDGEGKELIDFCDAVKKYERTTIPSDRLGQACVLYWEYFTLEGGRKLMFPSTIATDIQTQIQSAQTALRNQECDHCLPSSLFQHAMTHLEYTCFEKSGLLNKYVAALDQLPGGSGAGSATASAGNSGKDGSVTVSGSIPPQLTLFDPFSIMELNARISHVALGIRNRDEQHSALSKPVVAKPDMLIDSSGGLNDSRVHALDICRLFLAQAGLIPSPNSELGTPYNLKLLENGSKLERSLKHLDKSPTRETMKIGVIYVGRHQRTQHEILKNDGGCRAYELFLAQLGWKVDLLTHRGFAGGLDTNPRSLSNGTHGLYYASCHSEVMFHVVTMMPTKSGDPQQIDKKRHVGNDYVHIIWNDNDTRDYDPATITSHFNDVQIVICPMRKSQKGLYLIKIHSKDKVASFGPLQSGMVVHQADLARLVRQTAMNANRVCRSQTTLYIRPYPTRKKLVDEIVERYAVEYKESQLLSMLFSSPSTSASLLLSSASFGASFGNVASSD